MDALNDLILAAQSILDSGFDVQAFMSWQMSAFAALVSLLGPAHYYVQDFKRLTSETSPIGLLAGEGVLEAAKQEVLKAQRQLPSSED